MSTSRLDTARRNLIGAFQSTKSTSPTVHSVTFQPFGHKDNDDRIAVERYLVLNKPWLFLVLCDGHGGPETSEYTAKYLPRHLAATVERSIGKHFGGRLDHTNIHEVEPVITAMLQREIVRFDWIIGRAMIDVCPDPRTLSEEEALRLIDEHKEAIERAMHGTTLSVAVVDIAHRVMWAAGVGDSTIVMAHHHSEKDIVEADNSLLGCLAMSRGKIAHRLSSVSPSEFSSWHPLLTAIGDFSFKLHREYTRHIFRHINPKYAQLYERLRTPPYIIAEPSVRFVDLRPVWRKDPMLILFSDGVDLLVDGDFVFSPDKPSKLDTMDIIPALLSRTVDPRVGGALGHGIEPGWSRAGDNMAIDIIGNLLGGIDAERLEMVMDHQRLLAEDPIFHIDDTTIVVARLAS
ncbi:hypothetical protein TRAPUB_5629 [Trametes pubescens]|uniref:protein-serine/threonine phosphatase n=1 Tax=Trametes pubescens TaxID=154538 RepID=A0A1M2V7X3_TRAPU|nr:hypothetical protein TRAPUB_5629 [Trametes pubescens]